MLKKKVLCFLLCLGSFGAAFKPLCTWHWGEQNIAEVSFRGNAERETQEGTWVLDSTCSSGRGSDRSGASVTSSVDPGLYTEVSFTPSRGVELDITEIGVAWGLINHTSVIDVHVSVGGSVFTHMATVFQTDLGCGEPWDTVPLSLAVLPEERCVFRFYPYSRAASYFYMHAVSIYGTEKLKCLDGCGGHGYCDATLDTCVCDTGYAGINCSTPCPGLISVGGVPTPCNNHGVCDDGNEGYGTCTCDVNVPSYAEGVACEHVYCLHDCIRGYCDDDLLGCKCPEGTNWAGARCHLCVDAFGPECSDKCSDCDTSHGAVCVDGVDGECRCDPNLGWTGKFCDECPLDGNLFGPNCDQPCEDTNCTGRCVGGTTGGCQCDPSTGYVEDCTICAEALGFFGPGCNISCSLCYQYGDDPDEHVEASTCVAGDDTSKDLGCQCARARTGEFCQSCREGFRMYLGSCFECPPHKFSNTLNASTCTPCPDGQEQILTGQSECTPCAAGYVRDVSELGETVGCQKCPVGYYQPAEGQTTCLPCGPGTFQNKEGQESCEPCPLGHYADEPALEICKQCPAGTYASTTNTSVCSPCEPASIQPEIGQSSCDLCPPGLSQTEEGSIACEPCEPGFVAAGFGYACEACPPGFYQPAFAQSACEECPTGADCDSEGTTTLRPADGFWQVKEKEFVACDPPEACVRGACSDAYTGLACGVCKEGYFRLDGKCKDCPSNPALRLILFVVCILILIGGLTLILHRNRSRISVLKRSGFFSSVAIAFNFLQVMTVLATLRMEWPDPVGAVLGGLFIFGFNAEHLGAECSLSVSFEEKFVIVMFIPAICCLILFSPWIVTVAKNARTGQGFYRAYNMSKKVMDACINAAMSWMTLAYLFVASMVVSFFDCTSIGDDYVLRGNASYFCFDGRWFSFFIIPLIGLFCYVIGVPAFIAYVVTSRRLKLDKERVFARFGLLYIRYKRSRFFWEVVVISRKLLVLVAKVFFRTSFVQLLFIFLALVCFFIAQVAFRPYRHNRHNVFEASLQTIAVIAVIIGMLYDAEVMSVPVCVALVFPMVLLSFLAIIVMTIVDIKVHLDEQNKSPDDPTVLASMASNTSSMNFDSMNPKEDDFTALDDFKDNPANAQTDVSGDPSGDARLKGDSDLSERSPRSER